MAQIKFSSIVNEITGSIGGLTIQRNRYGFTAKSKGYQPFPSADLQRFAARNLSVVSKAWSQISPSARSNFETFASLFPQFPANGSTTPLSGYEVFCMFNMSLLFFGKPLQVDCTLDAPEYFEMTPTLNREGSNLFLSTPFQAPGSESYFFVKASKSFSAGYSSLSYKVPLIGVYFLPTISVDIASAYIAALGKLPEVNESVRLDITTFTVATPYFAAPQVYDVVVS